jgi:hypothetical protein
MGANERERRLSDIFFTFLGLFLLFYFFFGPSKKVNSFSTEAFSSLSREKKLLLIYFYGVLKIFFFGLKDIFFVLLSSVKHDWHLRTRIMTSMFLEKKFRLFFVFVFVFKNCFLSEIITFINLHLSNM